MQLSPANNASLTKIREGFTELWTASDLTIGQKFKLFRGIYKPITRFAKALTQQEHRVRESDVDINSKALDALTRINGDTISIEEEVI